MLCATDPKPLSSRHLAPTAAAEAIIYQRFDERSGLYKTLLPEGWALVAEVFLAHGHCSLWIVDDRKRIRWGDDSDCIDMDICVRVKPWLFVVRPQFLEKRLFLSQASYQRSRITRRGYSLDDDIGKDLDEGIALLRARGILPASSRIPDNYFDRLLWLFRRYSPSFIRNVRPHPKTGKWYWHPPKGQDIPCIIGELGSLRIRKEAQLEEELGKLYDELDKASTEVLD